MNRTIKTLANEILSNALREGVTETCADDLANLPLPAAAKAYARRGGLKSMINQPKAFQKVNAMLTNPGKVNKFQNYTAAKMDGNFDAESGGKTGTGFKVSEGGAPTMRTPKVALVSSRFNAQQYRAWEANLPEDITAVKVRSHPSTEEMLRQLGFKPVNTGDLAGGFWIKPVNNSPTPQFGRYPDEERDFE